MRLTKRISFIQRVAMLSGMVPVVLSAQTYTVVPSNSIVAVAPYNTYSHFIIEQHNTTGSYIRLGWEQLSVNVPPGWIADLCDLGNCFTGFPANGIMDTVFAGDYGLLSVAIDPVNIPGSATVRYAVWDVNTPAQRDTLTWIITAGPAGINETTAAGSFRVQPVASGNALLLITGKSASYTYSVTTLSGKTVSTGSFVAQQKEIPVPEMPAGIYLVSITEQNGKKQTRKIYFQHQR